MARAKRREGILREPRALWEIVSIDSSDTTLSPRSRVRLDKDNWYNGSRHTLVLTHVLMGPVGYLFREWPVAVPVDTTTFHAAGSVINRCQVFISAPYRQHFSRFDIQIPGYCFEPVWEPTTRYGGGVGIAEGEVIPGVSFRDAATLHGVARWDFDFDFKLPRKAAVDFDLSASNIGNFVVQAAIFFPEEPTEGYSKKAGSGRTTTDLLEIGDASGPGVFPAGPQPVPIDVFGELVGGGIGDQIQAPGAVTPVTPYSTLKMWPPQSQFQNRTFRIQEASRGSGSNRLSGFAIAWNQIAHDNQATLVIGSRLTPLAMKFSTRARSRGGGTEEWWWRPGAPLGLVCPSFSPALVHKFPEPLVLGPGDAFELDVEAPTPTTIGVTTISPTYSIGVSMCGYAEIEG